MEKKKKKREMMTSEKNKRAALWLILFFFITALAPLGLLLAGVDTPHYAATARPPYPEFTTEAGVNLKWTAQFDAAWSHRFPGNSALVTLFNKIAAKTVHASFNEDVIVGKADRLFYAETIPDMLKLERITDADRARIATVLQIQQRAVEAQGGQFIVAIAPNKASLYPEWLPARFAAMPGVSTGSLLNDALSARGITFVDWFAALETHKENAETALYHDFDSHWNDLGAEIAYRALLTDAKRGTLLPEFRETTTVDHAADLATMLYPAEKVREMAPTYADFKANYRYLRPLQSLEDLEIVTQSQQGTQRLLMFRDSFANALIPYLSSSFADATYLRQTAPDYRSLRTTPADLVVLQIAERNVDWWLQKTPILLAQETLPPVAVTTRKLDIAFEHKAAYGWHHLQARIPDLIVDAAVVVADGKAYEAFPVYEDDDITDHRWFSGVSLYLEAAPSAVSIYVHTTAGWIFVDFAG